MKLGVIADTHIPDRYEKLPAAVTRALMNVDLIVHAGDFTSLEYYQQLKKIKPLLAVYGNIDTVQLNGILREKETVVLEGYKIGLTHGFGGQEAVFENVKKIFNSSYDLVIFGHTHRPLYEIIGKTIYFNPGSPTDHIFTDVNSYGLIELKETIAAKIIEL